MREKLIETWMTRVLADPRIPSAHRLQSFELRDYVPRFVDVATETLRSSAYEGPVRVRAAQFARVHALERLAEDFHLDEVQREFDHLEEVVGEHVRPTGLAHCLMCTAIAEARRNRGRGLRRAERHALEGRASYCHAREDVDR